MQGRSALDVCHEAQDLVNVDWRVFPHLASGCVATCAEMRDARPFGARRLS